MRSNWRLILIVVVRAEENSHQRLHLATLNLKGFVRRPDEALAR